MNVIIIVIGILSIVYDFMLIILNPGTFLDNLTAFSHIWSVLGLLLIFSTIFKMKKGYSFWKNWKKRTKVLAISIISITVFIAMISLIFILNPKKISLEEECDYVILLGGGIDKDGNLPKTVQLRVDMAYEYMKKHENVKCVVTGGTLKWLPYPEGPEIKKQLIKRGIEKDRIYVEDKALDTIQNLQKSVILLSEKENKSIDEILKSKIVIITSDFHLRRAERLAKKMGFKNYSGIASKTPIFYILHNYVREICAYLKLNLRIIFTSKPEIIK